MEVPGRAVVGGGGEHVIGAEQGDFLPVVPPTHDAHAVEVNGSIGALRLNG